MKHQQSNICIFIGPPGSGKGSLSQLCAQELDVSHLSTGNLCRKHVVNQTKIGKKIDLLINSGKLIDDSLVAEMVHDWLEKKVNHICHIILDGFPRTVNQASMLYRHLKQEFPQVNIRVLKLSIASASVLNRLCNRYVCSDKNCQQVYSAVLGSSCAPKIDAVCDDCSGLLIRRSDDCESTIKERLKIYFDQERKLLSFFKDTGSPIMVVDADRSLQEVFIDVKKQLFTV